MGYIASSATITLRAFLTQKGRELLINGTDVDVTSAFFSLGDSDSNYNVDYGLEPGYVPDLSGDDSGCVRSVAENVGINYNAIYLGELENRKEVRLQKNTGVWTKKLRVLVHLDRMSRYFLFKSIKNTSVNNNTLDSAQLSPFADFYNRISVFEVDASETDISQTDENIKMKLNFNPNIFTRLSNVWDIANPPTVGHPTNFTISEGSNTVPNGSSPSFIKSPLMFAFSSEEDTINGGRLAGAGKGGVIIYGRELGYFLNTYTLGTGGVKNSVSGFPQFKLPSEVEGQTFDLLDDTSSPTKYTEIYPCAKIQKVNNIVVSDAVYLVNTPPNSVGPTQFFTSSNDDIAFNNQYSKLYKNGAGLSGGPSLISFPGLIQDEVTNLYTFIQSNSNKDIFALQAGSATEYRSIPLNFTVYAQDSTAEVGTLEIILKYDNSIVLSSDTSYNAITSAGNTTFIEYI